METFTLNCSSCGAPLNFDEDPGRIVRCPYCRNVILISSGLQKEITDLDEKDREIEPKATVRVSPVFDIPTRMGEITALAHAGKRIEAIKRFRESFAVSLKEAKTIVEVLEVGGTVNVDNLPLVHSTHIKATVLDQQTTNRIRQLLSAGNKLDAIKVYRGATGVGLKEARDVIDAMDAGLKMMDAMGANAPAEVHWPAITERTIKTATVAAGGIGLSAGCLGIGLTVLIVLITLVPILVVMTFRGNPLYAPWAKINPLAPARLLDSFGQEGKAPGEFDDARTIALDSQYIYVSEYEATYVNVFDLEGSFVARWKPEFDNIYSSYVYALSADNQGGIYAASVSALYHFNGYDGKPIGKLVHPDGATPTDLVITADGMVISAWYGKQDDIVRFRSDGSIDLIIQNVVSSVTGDIAMDVKVAVDNPGNIYALCSTQGVVVKYSSDGKSGSVFYKVNDEDDEISEWIYDIAADNWGSLYLSDWNDIKIYRPDASYSDQISASGFVYDMAFDPLGRLYILTNDARVSWWKIMTDK